MAQFEYFTWEAWRVMTMFSLHANAEQRKKQCCGKKQLFMFVNEGETSAALKVACYLKSDSKWSHHAFRPIQHSTPWWSDWMWTVEVGQGQSWGFRDRHRTCGQSCFEPYADFEGCMALLHFKCSPSWVTVYVETRMKRLWCHWKRVLPRWERLLTDTGIVGDEAPQGLAPGITNNSNTNTSGKQETLEAW